VANLTQGTFNGFDALPGLKIDVGMPNERVNGNTWEAETELSSPVHAIKDVNGTNNDEIEDIDSDSSDSESFADMD